MTARGWQRDGLILRYVGDLDADHGLEADVASTRPPVKRAMPREHGSTRGYHQHRYYGEQACEACKEARRKDRRHFNHNGSEVVHNLGTFGARLSPANDLHSSRQQRDRRKECTPATASRPLSQE